MKLTFSKHPTSGRHNLALLFLGLSNVYIYAIVALQILAIAFK